jgi:hypothetical protein
MANIGEPKRKIRIEPEPRREPARPKPRPERNPAKDPEKEKVPIKTA